jgi:hypothetical protein
MRIFFSQMNFIKTTKIKNKNKKKNIFCIRKSRITTGSAFFLTNT